MRVAAVLAKRNTNRQLTNIAAKFVANHKSSTWSSRFSLKYNLLLFRAVHVLLTFLVWLHFFQNKFWIQEAAVPKGPTGDGAMVPNYWWKRIVPPIEFGMMHMLLLQMTIIPLTMSRRLLCLMSRTLGSAFPFQDMVTFHIQVGYFFCVIIVVATILFFVFFGKLCSDAHNIPLLCKNLTTDVVTTTGYAGATCANGTTGVFNGREPKTVFCDKFKSEIFLTGLIGTFVPTALVLVTSYIRSKLRYEVFYVTHLLMLVMFAVALIHTIDDEARGGKARSQTVNWFGTSIVIFFTDRIFSLMNCRKCAVLEATPTGDETAIYLKIEKPDDFHFVAGQYATLRIPAIDNFWHAFSIGSAPDAKHLTFIIQVHGPEGRTNEWTRNLVSSKIIAGIKDGSAPISVQGPYGYPIADMQKSDSVVGVGTGTGIVPMLALFEQRVLTMRLVGKEALGNIKIARVAPPKIDPPAATVAILAAHETDSTQAKEQAMWEKANKTGILAELQLRYRTKSLIAKGKDSQFFTCRLALARAKARHNWVDVAGLFFIVLEVINVVITLSWANLLPVATKPFHAEFARALMCVVTIFHVLHCVYKSCFPERFKPNVWLWLDLPMSVLMIGLVCLWWVPATVGAEPLEEAASGADLGTAGPLVDGVLVAGGFTNPTWPQLMLRTILSTYRIVRMLQASPVLRTAGSSLNVTNVLGAEKYHMIFLCRSSDLASMILPHLVTMVNQVHLNIYGVNAQPGGWTETLGQFLDFTFYVTEPNPAKVEALKAMIKDTAAEGKVLFERPKMTEILIRIKAKQLIEYVTGIENTDMAMGFKTAVTFCGSPGVAVMVSDAVSASNDLSTILGYPQYAATFREEFYGLTGAPKLKIKKAAKIIQRDYDQGEDKGGKDDVEIAAA